MTLSDLEWLSEIFSDTKHRAVSLRQLSFLFGYLYRRVVKILKVPSSVREQRYSWFEKTVAKTLKLIVVIVGGGGGGSCKLSLWRPHVGAVNNIHWWMDGYATVDNCLRRKPPKLYVVPKEHLTPCAEISVPGHIQKYEERITADDIYDKTHTSVAFVV